MEEKGSFMKEWKKIISGAIIGILLLGIWLWIVDLNEIFTLFSQMRISLMLSAGCLFGLAYFARSIRWKIILASVERVTVLEAYSLCMTNYFINYFIPIHAGELAKSLLLKKIKGTPVSSSLITVYVDKVMDLLPIFLLLLITPLLSKRLSLIIYIVSGIALFIFILTFSILMLFSTRKESAMNFFEKMISWAPVKLKSYAVMFIDSLLEGLGFLKNLPRRSVEILGLTLLAALFQGICLWIFFYSFGVKLPILTILVGFTLLNTSFLLPAPPAFVGSLEITFLFIFTYIYGYDKNLVSAVAASSHIFSAVFFSLFGFLSLSFIGVKGTSIIQKALTSRP
jgi:uncharacterized protein (TIRG00374 family)